MKTWQKVKCGLKGVGRYEGDLGESELRKGNLGKVYDFCEGEMHEGNLTERNPIFLIEQLLLIYCLVDKNASFPDHCAEQALAYSMRHCWYLSWYCMRRWYEFFHTSNSRSTHSGFYLKRSAINRNYRSRSKAPYQYHWTSGLYMHDGKKILSLSGLII